MFFEYGYGFVGFVGRHRHDHSYTHIEDIEHLVVRYVAISLKEAEDGRNLPAALFDFDTLSFAEYTRDIFVETTACDVAYTVYVAATYDISNGLYIYLGRGEQHLAKSLPVGQLGVYFIQIQIIVGNDFAYQTEAVGVNTCGGDAY